MNFKPNEEITEYLMNIFVGEIYILERYYVIFQ